MLRPFLEARALQQQQLDPRAPTPLFYADDWEWQDTANFPSIDYRRDSVSDIIRILETRKQFCLPKSQ